MKTLTNTLTALLALSVAANALAEETEVPQHHIFVTTHKSDVGEICPELKAGQTLSFDFKAKKDVEFNLHYHQGEKVSYPIEPQTLTEIKDDYKAPLDQTYCLMWMGLEEKTQIQVNYSIIPEQPTVNIQ